MSRGCRRAQGHPVGARLRRDAPERRGLARPRRRPGRPVAHRSRRGRRAAARHRAHRARHGVRAVQPAGARGEHAAVGGRSPPRSRSSAVDAEAACQPSGRMRRDLDRLGDPARQGRDRVRRDPGLRPAVHLDGAQGDRRLPDTSGPDARRAPRRPALARGRDQALLQRGDPADPVRPVGLSARADVRGDPRVPRVRDRALRALGVHLRAHRRAPAGGPVDRRARGCSR